MNWRLRDTHQLPQVRRVWPRTRRRKGRPIHGRSRTLQRVLVQDEPTARPRRARSVNRLAPPALMLAISGCDGGNPLTHAVATVARHYFFGGVACGALGMLALVVLVMIATERRRDP